AAQPVADRVQLVVGDPEAAVERLLHGIGHGARLGHRHRAPTATGPPATEACAALSTTERMIPAPSAEPRMASAARSGCGISPPTLPRAEMTPAIARSEPFGLAAVSPSAATAPAAST